MCLSGVDTGRELWIVYSLQQPDAFSQVVHQSRTAARKSDVRHRVRHLGDGGISSNAKRTICMASSSKAIPICAAS